MLTKEAIFKFYNEKSLKKVVFGKYNNLKINNDELNSVTLTFSPIPWLCKLLEEETGISGVVKLGPYGEFYTVSTRDVGQSNQLRSWYESKKGFVFLPDCLPMSLALDFNFIDHRNQTYTILGSLENKAKHAQDRESIGQIIKHLISSISLFQQLNDSHLISYVPGFNKEFHLPLELSQRLSDALGKPLASDFKYNSPKDKKVKDLPMAEKWNAWEETGLTYAGDIRGKNILLIDDKYQSGITLQFVAKSLYDAGAGQVFGLSVVKTFRDSDNTPH